MALGGIGKRGGWPGRQDREWVGALQMTFGNTLMKMQFEDVTQPPEAQAKFSHAPPRLAASS